MTWQDIGGEPDTDAGTVSTMITHLSTYALMAHTRPADLSVTALTVAPATVNPGGSVVINTEIFNQGDLSGSCDICLTMDGVKLETKNITLPGGESEEASFTITVDTAGEHHISVGNKLASFTVDEPLTPPVFTLSNLHIDHLAADIGENTNIKISVQNTGDLPGEYNVILTVDDVAVDSKLVSLNGGSSEEVIFSYSSDIAGIHTVNIGNLVAPLEVKPVARQALPLTTEATPELESFNVSPYFNRETNKLIYARVVYKLSQTWESTPGTSLVLAVSFNGRDYDRVPLLSPAQLQSDGQTGELDYIPISGWEIGEYDFQAKLYKNDVPAQDYSSQHLTVTPESITTTVSWKTLGILICSILAAGVIIMFTVLYFRRNTLRDYWK